MRVSALGSPPNVRRQRHYPIRVKDRPQIRVRREAKDPPTMESQGGYRHQQVSACQVESPSEPSGLCRFHQSLPALILDRANQQHFDRFAILICPEKPGRNYLGVVQDQEVARAQVLWQVGEPPVLQPIRVPVKNQETRGIPFARRILCNEFRGKLVIKIVEVHLTNQERSAVPCPRRRGRRGPLDRSAVLELPNRRTAEPSNGVGYGLRDPARGSIVARG